MGLRHEGSGMTKKVEIASSLSLGFAVRDYLLGFRGIRVYPLGLGVKGVGLL